MALPDMVDLVNPDSIEVRISRDTKTIWINDGGMCLLRATHVENMSVVIEGGNEAPLTWRAGKFINLEG